MMILPAENGLDNRPSSDKGTTESCSARLMDSLKKLVAAAGLATLAVGHVFPASAETAPPAKVEEAATTAAVSSHQMSAGGRMLKFTATASTIPVINDKGEPEADIFFVAYTAEERDRSRRPLVFAFNGGPGSSSVWLHMGAIGPQRVAIDPAAGVPSPPYRLEANPASWIPFADVVLVDPVGTGLSRAKNREMMKKFSSVSGDVDSLGRFIRLYLSRHSRWRSPLFLAGESYGTLRVGGLAHYLQQRGIVVSGVVLISPVLDKQLVSYEGETDIGYRLLLPTLTATALHYGKLPPDVTATGNAAALKEAEEFASNEFPAVLGRGAELPPELRRRAVERLARLTGLPAEVIDEKDLRIDRDTFSTELLRDRSRVVVSHDARMSLLRGRKQVQMANAQVRVLKGAFSASLKGYLDETLGYRTDLEYFIEGEAIEKWDWQAENSFAETASKLSEVARTMPHLGIFVASGLYDMVTPYYAADYMLAHMDLPPVTRKKVIRKVYPGGHMVYLDPANAGALSRDVADFIEKTMKEDSTQSGDAAVLWGDYSDRKPTGTR